VSNEISFRWGAEESLETRLSYTILVEEKYPARLQSWYSMGQYIDRYFILRLDLLYRD